MSAVLALVLVGGCSGSGQDTTTSSTETTVPTATETTTTTSATTTTAGDEIPGEPIDFGPVAGDELGVVGVAHDDVLNVRALPGTDAQIVAELAPTATGIEATGHNRALPESVWYEINLENGATGWVSSAFVGYIGTTDDATAEVIQKLGETPGAEFMLDLGLIVAESLASTEPESRITMSVAPEVGDLGEVTYDVIGLGDDAIGGYRLHVFGDPIVEAFVLSNVERTYICSRGVTPDGLCT
ncbi:MAG: SH3 domain-containing protein [Acidimicrobiia bacterium]